MRKWISMIVMVAFVGTTMPSAAHAAMSHDGDTHSAKVENVSTEQAKAPAHEGCPGHDESASKTSAKSEKTADKKSKSCCDGLTCKCVGNSCNGPVKILGSSNFGFFSPLAVKAPFSFEERIADSDHFSRIKRPPRV